MIGTETSGPVRAVGALGVARETGKSLGSVPREYDQLGMVIERIELHVSSLQDQLSPILGHEPAVPGDEAMKEPSHPAPFANGLREHRYRLENIERALKSLQSQIEL